MDNRDFSELVLEKVAMTRIEKGLIGGSLALTGASLASQPIGRYLGNRKRKKLKAEGKRPKMKKYIMHRGYERGLHGKDWERKYDIQDANFMIDHYGKELKRLKAQKRK